MSGLEGIWGGISAKSAYAKAGLFRKEGLTDHRCF
jgi:hypothetical protein